MTPLGILSVVLTTTLDCNFHCPWCKRWEFNERFGLSPDYMSVETCKAILEKNPYAHVVLTGGEPMLNTPLLEYVVSKDRDMKVSTNGSIIWPERLEFP